MLESIILLPAATPCDSRPSECQYLPAQQGKDFSICFQMLRPRYAEHVTEEKRCSRDPWLPLAHHITCKHGRTLLFHGILSAMPSEANPQALMQKQKRCPAVHTTPARCHWVTVKPYSKVYLSSLKGSALTLGVSIDLGNTVPSAPEITKQNRRQIVNIISCYQGSDCQIIPRHNLTHRLTPFLSCAHPSSPQEKPDLDHLKLVALITTAICLKVAFLDVKVAACTLAVGSVCQTSWCSELGKDTLLVARHLIQLHPSLMNPGACHDIISFPGLFLPKEKTKFCPSHCKCLCGQAVLPGEKEGGVHLRKCSTSKL